mmetsp:Transcript_58736/g.171892  ORF Transcript_58736/g.171892 Transcript_58736/m.171892 type:complete len:173 (+) Transcript_58736:1255-1773(+)
MAPPKCLCDYGKDASRSSPAKYMVSLAGPQLGAAAPEGSLARAPGSPLDRRAEGLVNLLETGKHPQNTKAAHTRHAGEDVPDRVATVRLRAAAVALAAASQQAPRSAPHAQLRCSEDRRAAAPGAGAPLRRLLADARGDGSLAACGPALLVRQEAAAPAGAASGRLVPDEHL